MRAECWKSTPCFSSLSFISNYPCKEQVRQRVPSVKTSVPVPKVHIKVQLDAVPLHYDGSFPWSFGVKVFQFFSFNFSKILGWFRHSEHVKCVNFEKTANSESLFSMETATTYYWCFWMSGHDIYKEMLFLEMKDYILCHK